MEHAKLTVLERMNVRSVRPELLDRLHDNDPGLTAELLQDLGPLCGADPCPAPRLTAPDGTTLRLHRVLRPAPHGASLVPEGTTGHVGGAWQLPDGTRARGLFAALHTGSRG